ncbi:MAG: tRNA preQ1(34) S-adenosylmethionine ribosyltransferase-isomerase QueA [Chitinispirillaceae bacterium]|nr:tRNA preQ1(34) S-adenosylmethionine ribosyltransferase-isomerase QueA [Chitinispirillaceae bacterium]
MRTEDFRYELPDGLIARQPVLPRDSCRLMTVPHRGGPFRHLRFTDLPGLLQAGDRLVFNDTRVLPARVFTRKKGSGARIELFFLEAADDVSWKALVRPGRRVHNGTVLSVEDRPDLELEITGILPGGERLIAVKEPRTMTIPEIMELSGHVPLPHYIHRDDVSSDRLDYQTVYASVPGAVAAPTAGLHFTASLMERLRNSGIGLSYITLHVGIGTFRPVKTENPADHEMHEERYCVSAEAAREITDTRKAGGRIIAVGTTVVRVLEHCHLHGKLTAHTGSTRIMILPPYRFGMVDGLITNFHLPESTLLMLVSAFCGRERILQAYNEAIVRSYRFYSYGDAMFLF